MHVRVARVTQELACALSSAVRDEAEADLGLDLLDEGLEAGDNQRLTGPHLLGRTLDAPHKSDPLLRQHTELRVVEALGSDDLGAAR